MNLLHSYKVKAMSIFSLGEERCLTLNSLVSGAVCLIIVLQAHITHTTQMYFYTAPFTPWQPRVLCQIWMSVVYSCEEKMHGYAC